jgi:hypothetical protein
MSREKSKVSAFKKILLIYSTVISISPGIAIASSGIYPLREQVSIQQKDIPRNPPFALIKNKAAFTKKSTLINKISKNEEYKTSTTIKNRRKATAQSVAFSIQELLALGGAGTAVGKVVDAVKVKKESLFERSVHVIEKTAGAVVALLHIRSFRPFSGSSTSSRHPLSTEVSASRISNKELVLGILLGGSGLFNAYSFATKFAKHYGYALPQLALALPKNNCRELLQKERAESKLLHAVKLEEMRKSTECESKLDAEVEKVTEQIALLSAAQSQYELCKNELARKKEIIADLKKADLDTKHEHVAKLDVCDSRIKEISRKLLETQKKIASRDLEDKNCQAELVVYKHSSDSMLVEYEKSTAYSRGFMHGGLGLAGVIGLMAAARCYLAYQAQYLALLSAQNEVRYLQNRPLIAPPPPYQQNV